jgi:hypothetical protein
MMGPSWMPWESWRKGVYMLIDRHGVLKEAHFG